MLCMDTTFMLCFLNSVRQVFPIIRGNETVTTYDTASKKKKRSISDHGMNRLNAQGYIPHQPEFVMRHSWAAKEPAEPLESRILNKKLRLLRLAGLQEEKTPGKGVKIVARKEFQPPSHEMKKKEALKTKFQARYKRSSRVKRQAFDPEAWGRMQIILEHKEAVTRRKCFLMLHTQMLSALFVLK